MAVDCGNPYPGVEEFNLQAYTGCWYTYGTHDKYGEHKYPDDVKCNAVQFSISEDKANTFKSIFKGISPVRGDKPTDKPTVMTVQGQATMDDPQTKRGNFVGEKGGRYIIIGTDYKNYALAYHCTPTSEGILYTMLRNKHPECKGFYDDNDICS